MAELGVAGPGRDGANAGRLVERSHELAVLAESVESALAGAGGVILVEAGAGLGKSALVDAALDMARARGAHGLYSRCSPLEADFPFGVVLQLFERHLHRADDERRRRWFRGRAAAAAPLFDIDAGPWSQVDTADAYSRLHGLLWLASNLAGEAGLVLAIDDGQWADRRSLEFLHYLGARIGGMPALLIVTARTSESGAASGLIEELHMLPGAQTLRPDPLTAEAVATIVRGTLPDADDELCHACWHASGGNPFLLKELLLTFSSSSEGTPSADRVAVLKPESVGRAVLVRLARMPAGALDVARAVSVLGSACTVPVLREMIPLPPDQTTALIDRLIAGEILRRGEDGAVGFVHPIIEGTIRAGIPPSELEAAHLRAAEVLYTSGATAEAIASHCLRSSPHSLRWVVDILRESAARATATGSPAVAARQLERAVAEPPPDDLMAHVLAELGRASLSVGTSDAGERLVAAADQALEPEVRAQLLVEAARAHAVFGRAQEAGRALIEALRVSGSGDNRGWIWSEARAVSVDVPVPGVNWTVEDHGAGSGSSGTDLAYAAMAATRQALPGEEAVELARKAIAECQLLDGPADGMVLHLATRALVWNDEAHDGLAALDRALDDANKRGHLPALAAARAVRAMTLRLLGDLPGAVADARACMEAARVGWRLYLPYACGELALAELDRGYAEAAAAAAAFCGDAAADESPLGYAAVLYARGVIDARAGRDQDALGKFLAVGSGLVEVGFVTPLWIPWRSEAGVLMGLAGRMEEAEALIQEELRLARQASCDRAVGVGLRALARIRDGEEGLLLLSEAADLLSRSPARLTYAHCLADLGSSLRRAGQRAESRSVLQRSLDLAARSGARALEKRAREELEMCGARPRRAALTGPESLTAGERRVAELVARGRTNREISEALYISTKTVEYHLRQIFLKLGISRRQDIGGLLVPDLPPETSEPGLR